MFLPKRIKMILCAIVAVLLIGLFIKTGMGERLAFRYYCQCPEKYRPVSGVVTDIYEIKQGGGKRPYSAYKYSMTVSYIKDGEQQTCTLIKRRGDQVGNAVSLAVADKGLFQVVRTDELPYSTPEKIAIAQFILWLWIVIGLFTDMIKINRGQNRIGKERVRIKNEKQYREDMMTRFPLPEAKCSRRELRQASEHCQCVLGGSLPGTLCWFLTHMNLDYFIQRGFLFGKIGRGYRFVDETKILTGIGIWEYFILKYEDDYYVLYRIEDGMMYKYDLNEAADVSLNCNFYEYMLRGG